MNRQDDDVTGRQRGGTAIIYNHGHRTAVHDGLASSADAVGGGADGKFD